MQSETTTAITAVKQDVRLREWAEQLEAQQASGLTVPQWCAENGIKTKSFYYRLQKVREQYIRSAQAVVPLTVPQQQSADIRIEKNDLHISLPTSITQDTLLALVNALAYADAYLCSILKENVNKLLIFPSDRAIIKA